MNRKQLIYYGGSGFDSVTEGGEYHVNYGELNIEIETKFNDLSKAIEFYESIGGEKAFWDDTTIPELIDAWFYGDPNDDSEPDFFTKTKK